MADILFICNNFKFSTGNVDELIIVVVMLSESKMRGSAVIAYLNNGVCALVKFSYCTMDF